MSGILLAILLGVAMIIYFMVFKKKSSMLPREPEDVPEEVAAAMREPSENLPPMPYAGNAPMMQPVTPVMSAPPLINPNVAAPVLPNSEVSSIFEDENVFNDMPPNAVINDALTRAVAMRQAATPPADPFDGMEVY